MALYDGQDRMKVKATTKRAWRCVCLCMFFVAVVEDVVDLY